MEKPWHFLLFIKAFLNYLYFFLHFRRQRQSTTEKNKNSSQVLSNWSGKELFQFPLKSRIDPKQPPVSSCSLSKDKHVFLRWANLMQYMRLMGRLCTSCVWELLPWLQIYRSCQANKLADRWVASKVIGDPWPHLGFCKAINTFAQMHK